MIDTETMTKTCSKCGINKPLSMFYTSVTKRCDGYQSKCIDCALAYYRNKPRIRKVSKSIDGKTKTCTKCDIQKPIDMFSLHKNAADGHSSWCKACATENTKANYIPERQREYSFKRHYGITVAEYELLLAKQNGVCAICKQPSTQIRLGKLLNLHIDHNHETGNIRGLLCSRCNVAVGMLKNDPEIARELAKYLER